MTLTPAKGFILVTLSPDYRRQDQIVRGKVTLQYQPAPRKKKGESVDGPEELFGPLHASIIFEGRLIAKVSIDHGTTETSIWRSNIDDRLLFHRRVILHDGPIRLTSLTSVEYPFEFRFPDEPDDKKADKPSQKLPPTFSVDFTRSMDRGKVDVTYRLQATVEMPGIDVRAVSRGSTQILQYDPLNEPPPAFSKNSGIFVQSYTIRSSLLTPAEQRPRGLQALFSRRKNEPGFSFSLLIASFPTCLQVGKPITFKLSALAHPEASSSPIIPDMQLRHCRIIFRTLTSVYTRQTSACSSAASGPVKEEKELSSEATPKGPILGAAGSEARVVWISTAPIQGVVGTFHTDNIRRHYTVQVDVEVTVLKQRVKMSYPGFPLFIQAGTCGTPHVDGKGDASTRPVDKLENVQEDRFTGWSKQQIDDLHEELTGKKRWTELSARMQNLKPSISLY